MEEFMTTDNTNPFIANLVDDFNKVQELLLPVEPTTAQNLSVHLTKILILACASFYEQQLQSAYIKYADREALKYGTKPHSFNIDKKDKSVYQKFSFGKIEDPKDLNELPDIKRMLKPLRAFGEAFGQQVYEEINGNEEKEKQLKAFQEMFAIRNLIAHHTFVEFASDGIRGKSFLDIKNMHEEALKFVDYLKEKFS